MRVLPARDAKAERRVASGAADLADEARLHGDGDHVVGVLHLLRDEHGTRVVTEAEVRNGLVGLQPSAFGEAHCGGLQPGL